MSEHPERIVVAGGGLAGVSLCVELRRRGHTGSLTIVDPGDVLHDRPPLSKAYLAGEVDEEGIKLQPDSWFADHDVHVRHGVTVTRAVPADGYVELSDGGTLPADVAVIATGGTARRLPVPGGDGPRVYYLRTLATARHLRARLTPGTHVAMIGGGLVGAELASTMLSLGCRVTLVDPALPLERVVGREFADWLHAEHARRGVTTRTAGVTGINDSGSGLKVTLDDGSAVEADLAVVGIGMVADTRAAAASGARVEGGVVVDERQRTSVPDLYAIGDCTVAELGGVLQPPAEHWEAAAADAARAAAAILGEPAPEPSHRWWWSDRHDLHVEVIGQVLEGRDVVRGTFGQPPFTVFKVDGDRLLGLIAVDSPQSVAAARRILARSIPVDSDALADPDADLRRLVRAWMKQT